MNDYFNDLCATRDNPYEIDLELAVRKILEKNTDKYYEFHKNDNKYEYDICCFNYNTNHGDWAKKLLGFIEVEISQNWIDKYPDYWKDYSYCRRKIHEFNNVKNEFTNDLKENAENTIYIIFNKNLTDAFCNSMNFINNNFKATKRNFGNLDEYHSWFLTADKNSDKVIRGLNRCLDKINIFFNIRGINND